jgi:surfeit locus 1 family protein
LVNRGWIAHQDRTTLPTFDTPTGELTLTTRVYQPSKAPYSLGELVLHAGQSVQRLNYLDIEQIAVQMKMDLYPLSLRLSAENLHGFDTYWPEINVKPETHIGYAVQWFLFAALAVIVFIFANSNVGTLIRKRDK